MDEQMIVRTTTTRLLTQDNMSGLHPISIRVIRGYNSECTNRKRAKLSHLHRHSEELKTAIRQLSKTAEMLNDRNIVTQQNRMRRSIAVARRVNIERINPNERSRILRPITRSA